MPCPIPMWFRRTTGRTPLTDQLLAAGYALQKSAWEHDTAGACHPLSFTEHQLLMQATRIVMEWCDAGSLADALQDGRLQVLPASRSAKPLPIQLELTITAWLQMTPV